MFVGLFDKIIWWFAHYYSSVEPFADGTVVLYNKFNVNSSRPPVNHPNSNYNCVVDTSRQWTVAQCHQRHLAVCHSVEFLPGIYTESV